MHAAAHGEVLRNSQAKLSFKILYVGVGLGTGALFTIAALSLRGRIDTVEDVKRYIYANIAVSFLCTTATFTCLAIYLRRIWQVWKAGLKLSLRMRRIQWLLFAEISSHALSTLFYFIPNVYATVALDMRQPSVHDQVLRWSAFVRMTMWNNILSVFVLRARMGTLWLDSEGNPVGREDALLVDGPLRKHWFVGVLWLVMEGLNVFAITYPLADGAKWVEINSWECKPQGPLLTTTVGIYVCFVVYRIVGLVHIFIAYNQLQSRPYNLFRLTNMGMRVQYVEVNVISLFLIFSLVLLWFPRSQSCVSLLLIWFGMLPPQFGMSFWVIHRCVMTMPFLFHGKVDGGTDRLTWKESHGNEGDSNMPNKDKEMEFCFETMLKAWYWTMCAYGYDPDKQECFDPTFEGLSLNVAKGFYGLQHHEHMRSDLDIPVLIAWNSKMIVISFRGTYSVANVWSDLQFWRVFHPPRRGHYLLQTAPLVHRGFLHCWTKSGFNHRILNKVIQITHSPGFDKSRMRVLVTGHSLGGAIAVLASYDVATLCGLKQDQISCYTFGAPRVGNHAFVRDYDSHVPNTWQIINDQDVVSRMPKFWIFFKHVGERVIVNQAGDMIIAPLFIEVSLHKCFRYIRRSNTVGQHFLLSYLKSMKAIIQAQFVENKSLEGGLDAMIDLFERGSDIALSKALGVDVSKLRELENGWKPKCLGKSIKRRSQLLLGVFPVLACCLGKADVDQPTRPSISLTEP